MKPTEKERIEQLKLQQLEVEKQKVELEKQKTEAEAKIRADEEDKKQQVEQIKLKQLEVEKQKAEAEANKAHWEQMRAEIQAKDNTKKLEAQTALATAQRSRADSAEKAIKEFKELREDGQSVTPRDLNTMVLALRQPRLDDEIGRRPKIWTAPISYSMPALPED